MSQTIEIILFLYFLGLSFLAGIAVGDRAKPTLIEYALVLIWPVTIPGARVLQWWQWGGKHQRRYRYMDSRWYQRGAKKRRTHGPGGLER